MTLHLRNEHLFWQPQSHSPHNSCRTKLHSSSERNVTVLETGFCFKWYLLYEKSKVIVHSERIRKLQRSDFKENFQFENLEARLVVSQNLEINVFVDMFTSLHYVSGN